jgi:succinate dehydrogenase/fumarate reductase flavoprotein subunit
MSQIDVIVVGGGGAGMAAAIEAARWGRRVVLLEQNPALGGSTAWSVGSISATGTWQQKAAGIADHPDAHFEDMEAFAGPLANRDNRTLRRVLVDNTTELMTWLESLGLVFAGPQLEPPHRVPRMHNVLPNSRAFPEMLGRECHRLGVQVRLGTAADSLIVEEGRVVGVRLANGQEMRAAGGVVLAGGDYSANAEMRVRFAGEEKGGLEAVNPTATGGAIRMALALGCEVLNGDLMSGPTMRFVPPTRESLVRRLPPRPWLGKAVRWAMNTLPDAIQRPFAMSFLTTALGPSRELFEAGAILVNRDGERFCDERARPAAELPKQPERLAYLVLDAGMAAKFTAWPHFVSTAPGIAYAYLPDYRRNRRDIYHEGADAEALAGRLGVPATALAESLARLPGRGPYVALGPIKSYVVFTEGGVPVTERLEVLGPKGTVIPGLYAAGSTGQGGLLLEGHCHHLAWAFISGRIAGRNAAHEVAQSIAPPAISQSLP